jgi:UDP-2,3-diacylglucosamine hydrolase
MRLLLVSDLHLAPSVRALKQWQDFLRAARDVDVLYILGDLFEYWVGDRQLQDPFFYEVALTLEQYTRKIAPVFLLPGNRDFLLGKKFFTFTHVQPLPDPSLIHIDGNQVLLTHGDLLCTDDKAYQRFRKMARNPILKRLFLCLPYQKGLKLATQARKKSMAAQDNLAPFILDVNDHAVKAMSARFGVDTIIHGHTHRPNYHRCYGLHRVVLPSWENGPAFLSYEGGCFYFAYLEEEQALQKRKIS